MGEKKGDIALFKHESVLCTVCDCPGCLEKHNKKCLCSSVFIKSTVHFRRERKAKGSCEESIDIVGFYWSFVI